jgi:predicted dithiol-disulfide oxidoreductase (DUF899 family)
MSTSVPVKAKVASREEWLAARKQLLQLEKALTRQKDEVNRQRLELPWVKVEKQYLFDTPSGKRSLAELFEGRSQLFIKHFMMGPGWKEGCVGCSFEVDHIEGALPHLNHHDITYVAIARAPLAEIEAFKKRMGWKFPWVSSYESEFNYDFGVSYTKEQIDSGTTIYNFDDQTTMEEESGQSTFYKDENGDVFHTYSAFARGGEDVITSYAVLDLCPKGRNETGPRHNLTDWVRHHDRYDAGGHVDETGRYHAIEKVSDCGCG